MTVSKYEYHHAVDQLLFLGLIKAICREDILSEHLLDKLSEKAVHFSLRHVGQTLRRYARNLWIIIYFPIIEFGILIFVKFVHVSKTCSGVEEVKLLIWLIPLILDIGLLWKNLFLFANFETWWVSLFYGQNFLLNRLWLGFSLQSLFISHGVLLIEFSDLLSSKHLRCETVTVFN